jgi:hypothetical protein
LGGDFHEQVLVLVLCWQSISATFRASKHRLVGLTMPDWPMLVG